MKNNKGIKNIQRFFVFFLKIFILCHRINLFEMLYKDVNLELSFFLFLSIL